MGWFIPFSSKLSLQCSTRLIHIPAKAKMAKTVKDALQQGELYSDQENYTFLKMPVESMRIAANVIAACSSKTLFRGLLYDKDEITLMISEKDHTSQKSQLEGPHIEVGPSPYRLITFDVVMDPNLIGFMHAVTKVLADEKISVLPFAAFSRDHIFVQEKDFERAMVALERLRQGNE